MSTNIHRAMTGAHAVIADATDPARRQDVLFRTRREPGTEMSSWWPVVAFVGVTVVVVSLLNFMPG